MSARSPTPRCRFVRAAALARAVALGLAVTRAQDEAASSSSELSKDAQTILQGGLDYLADADQQGADGSVRAQGTSISLRLATTSLAGLAWLAQGSTPTRGRYKDKILKA